MKKQTRNEIWVDVKDHCGESGISVSEWHNGEGVDITVSQDKIIQAYSFTHSQIEAIATVVMYLRSGIKDE